MTNDIPRLAIVVPCYNEEAALPDTAHRLLTLTTDLFDRNKIADDSCIYFVDDGSKDATWDLIEQQCTTDKRVKGIKLSTNCGHQHALLAGLLNVEGDAIVSIDADLQDDINTIEEMLDAFNAGNDIVYGVRKMRDTDSWFKRFTAHGYYHLLKLMGVDIVFDHADFRLLSRRAVDALAKYPEVNVFLRGMVPMLGFRSTKVYYDRRMRVAGESKYPISRMLALAINGVTSFSSIPLRLVALLGLFIFSGTSLLSLWVLWERLISGTAIPGWASSVLPIYFLGGVQLLSIGVLGEYIGRLYLEVKRRPRYIIEKTTQQ